jgi:hypothetical protein
MASITPNLNFKGEVTNDDNVLAIDISDTQDAEVEDYAVVQGHIAGVDAQISSTTSDKQYIRAGQSSTKTSTQRTFKATGDREIGDDFQDYAFALERLYGTGQAVVVKYVWFCMLNGKGEKGQVAIMVNSDGSGNAGETAGIDIDLKKTGDKPTEFIYSSSKG